tara:strand:- start:182 stop:340 length:159 start_codon:yes stop_codon:yes gene_type:complete
MTNTKQKEILKKIRALPLRKYGSAKHNKLIKELNISSKRQATSSKLVDKCQA